MPVSVVYRFKTADGRDFTAEERDLPYEAEVIEPGPVKIQSAQAIIVYLETPEEEAARDIGKAARKPTIDPDKLGRLLAQAHPTTVQNTFRVMMGFVRALADDFEKGNYDARSEGVCRFAKAVVDRMGEELDAVRSL
jgi:hypothetical protein